MDVCDQADMQNELAVAAALTKRKPVPKADGRCLNCREPVAVGQKYCDHECSEDHEYRERFKRLGR